MTDPHPVRWMRDVEVLLWTTSSGKKLRLSGGRSTVGVLSRVFVASVYEWVGGWDGSGEPCLRDALVRNVG